MIETGPNETGVTTIGTEVAGPIGAMIVRDTMTGIQVIVVTGIGTTEVDTEGTVGQGPGPPGGRDPGRGITEDGDGLKKD